MTSTIRKFAIALATSALVFSALSGCSSDSSEGTNQNQENQNQNQQNQNQENQNQNQQNQNQNQQNQNQNQQNQTELEIPAAHVLVDMSPTRFRYIVDESVAPSATVYDTQWDEIDADVEWSVSPDASVESSGDGQWAVREEGHITFEACVVDDGELTSICGEKTIVSSSGANTVVLESPMPGQHFDGAEDDMIPVAGSVKEGLSIDSVQINGETIDVDGEGRFNHEITPRFGVNTVVARAFDGVNPVDGIAAASVLWAPDYMAPDIDSDNSTIRASIDEALVISLGQNFLDDGEPYTEIPEVQIIAKDLADILHLVLENIDIADELPSPVVDSNSLVLDIPDVAVNEPNVELLSTNDGIDLFAQIPDLNAETAGFIEISDETIDLEGEISAGVSLFASVEIEKPDAETPFHVELVDFELAVEHATPNFESDEANAIFELADSVLRDNIEEILLDGIDLSFIDALPDMLLDVFESLEEVLSGQDFDLELDFGDPVTLSFDGQVEQFTPIHGEGLEGFVSADLTVNGDAHFPDKPGIPLMQTEAASSPLFSESRVQLGLDFALINAIFHSLWNAGLLDLDVTDMVEDNFSGLIESGHAEGLLPPVLSPPTGDSAHDLLLHLGQLEFELEWASQTDRFGAELVVGADLELVGDEVSLEIADEPEITLWLIESTDDEPLLDSDDLLQVIDLFLWPEVEAMLGDSLSLELPIPGIDALAGYAPALEEMNLDVRMTRPMDIRQGYLMLDAAVEGELFLP